MHTKIASSFNKINVEKGRLGGSAHNCYSAGRVQHLNSFLYDRPTQFLQV